MQLIITETDENITYWRERPYLNYNTKSLLDRVDVIIVPEENFRGHETPLFPSNMMELYDALKEHLNVEAAINDEDYREVSLNSKKHRIGKFVVVMLAAPLFVTVLGNYISERLKNEDPKDEIEVEIIVNGDNGKSKSIKYQGTARHFDKVAETVKDIVNGEHNEHRTDSAQSPASHRTK